MWVGRKGENDQEKIPSIIMSNLGSEVLSWPSLSYTELKDPIVYIHL